MFEDALVDQYVFDEVPLHRDLYIMPQRWIEKYHRYLERVFSQQNRLKPKAPGAL